MSDVLSLLKKLASKSGSDVLTYDEKNSKIVEKALQTFYPDVYMNGTFRDNEIRYVIKGYVLICVHKLRTCKK